MSTFSVCNLSASRSRLMALYIHLGLLIIIIKTIIFTDIIMPPWWACRILYFSTVLGNPWRSYIYLPRADRSHMAAGLDIKQFGPLAQGASRFEKSLAQGPVDFASHWPTNSRHRQHAHSLRQNRSHGKSCNSVHCLL